MYKTALYATHPPVPHPPTINLGPSSIRIQPPAHKATLSCLCIRKSFGPLCLHVVPYVMLVFANTLPGAAGAGASRPQPQPRPALLGCAVRRRWAAEQKRTPVALSRRHSLPSGQFGNEFCAVHVSR
jgi:hypothetical protein